MNDETSRLNKLVAHATGMSRREIDQLIEQGEVRVNGEIAALGNRVSASDVITIKGEKIVRDSSYTYIVVNKPVGYVCSRKAQGDNPTIYSILPDDYERFKPVGRLDKDSSGLLLLTDDGDFAFRMTHPSFHKTKTYEISLDKELEPLHQQMISDYGVTLEDGVSQLTLERLNDDRLEWKVAMHEGRNRQIRRTFASLGYSVTKLHRIQFGPYSIDDIQSGDFKVTKNL